jgi:hypothetical protein
MDLFTGHPQCHQLLQLKQSLGWGQNLGLVVGSMARVVVLHPEERVEVAQVREVQIEEGAKVRALGLNWG